VYAIIHPQLIKTSDESIGPATLVLVNGSPNKIMSREWDKIKKIIDNTPLRVIVITYANTNESSGGGEQLVHLAQYGGFYKVPETTTTSANLNLEQNEILNSIFLRIINENVGTPLNKVS
jgi:homoserine trans-succinylase